MLAPRAQNEHVESRHGSGVGVDDVDEAGAAAAELGAVAKVTLVVFDWEEAVAESLVAAARRNLAPQAQVSFAAPHNHRSIVVVVEAPECVAVASTVAPATVVGVAVDSVHTRRGPCAAALVAPGGQAEEPVVRLAVEHVPQANLPSMDS